MNLSTLTLEQFYNQSSLPKPRNEATESYVYFNGRDYSLSVLGMHKNKTINFNILHQDIVIMLKWERELYLCYKRSLTSKEALYIERKESLV